MDHNNPDSKKLLTTLHKIICVVTRYQKDIRDLPFDWVRELFLPSVLRGWKISYPSDDDECETVNGNKTVEGPLKDPLCSRLCISNLATPGHLVAHNLDKVHMTCSLHENEENFPDAKEDKIWLELKEFDKGTHESEGTNPEFDDGERKSIGVDHPIVSAVGNFAVAAFNKACKKFKFHLVYRNNSSTYDLNMGYRWYESNGSILLLLLGIYMQNCGWRTGFSLYLYHFECTAFERPTAASELCRLKRIHVKFRKVLLLRCDSARLRCPPDFNRMTNPDDWRDPGDHRCSGMVRRAKGTSCSGYDYYNPYLDG
ncbi:hypothetical protein Tco_0679521 [Tanacetum coccineum]|uniref:Uncharacterized protein n=1 Tax=Tanacetum coccineum TaxID=301880 RepID=A0ABQ4XIR8_9ASTR